VLPRVLGLALLAIANAALAQAVRLSAEPAEVHADDTAPVRLTLELERPADDVVLTASAGRLEAERISATRYAAKWLKPSQTWPELVMIAAVARRGEASDVALLPLPLWGRGWANVTARPGARVVMKISDRTYGPVTADARGIARVPFEAAPHESFAEVGSRRIDLKLPHPHGALLVLDHASISAGGDEVLARLFFFDARGGPVPAPQLELLASSGSVGAPTLAEPGRLDVRWSVGANGAPTEHLDCKLERLQLGASLPRRPPAAVAVELGGEPVRIEAGRPSEVAVRVVGRDLGGSPVPVDARLTPELGIVSPFAADGSATWKLPADLGARDRVALDVEARGRGELLHGRWSLEVQRKATRLEVRLPPALVADETDTVLEVRVLDAFGHPLGAAPPSVTSELASLSEPRRADAGTFALDYRSPALRAPRTDVVAVRVAGLQERREVTLLPRPARLSAGARLGLLTNASAATTWWVGAELGGFFSLLGQRFGVLAGVGYFQLGAASGSSRATSRWLCIDGSGVWTRALAGPLSVELGLGGGISAIEASASVQNQPPVIASGAVPSAHLLATLLWRLWYGGAQLSLRGAYFADPTLVNFRGALWALLASVGYRFDVF
jgi:hypothetical protein